MARLLLYNPENDLALANNALSYTPTRAAASLAESGLMLPLWWSEPNDIVIIPPHLSDIAKDMKQSYSLPGEIAIDASGACKAMPWGWSRDTRRRLQAMGIPEVALPTEQEIEHIRALSHRRTSIKLHQLLHTPANLMPKECHETETALKAITTFGNAVIKMPWSSSGRGVFFTDRISQTMCEKTVNDVIHRQGSVIVEPYLHKLKDFALLFYCHGGMAEYRGLSLFATDTNGHYKSNILAPQEILAELAGIDPYLLSRTIAQALSMLIAPFYSGWIGVDMMTYRTLDASRQIWPCVEINMRMTMGVVALYVSNRALPPGKTGQMTITRGSISPNAIDLSPSGGALKFQVV